jgi:hypothetical protein
VQDTLVAFRVDSRLRDVFQEQCYSQGKTLAEVLRAMMVAYVSRK